MNGSADGAPEGAARWLSVHDDLLRGLTHSASNRLGAIASLTFLLQQPTAAPATAVTVHAEIERLEALIQLLRALPRRPDAALEPLIPADAVQQAIALVAHHPAHRDTPITVHVDGDPQPAYAEPASLTLAVTVLLVAAERALAGAGSVQVRISSTTDLVTLHVEAQRIEGTSVTPDAEAAADRAAVRWLLETSRAACAVTSTAWSLSVPTLQAARRR